MPVQRRRILTTTSLTGRATVPATTLLPDTTRNRRTRRAGELVDAVARFDAAPDPQAQRELLDFVESLYEEQDLTEPVALFSTCYLGHPYIDHVMALDGSILTHFKKAGPLPREYEAARALARSGAYAFIELYADGAVVPVRETGDPVI